MISVDCRRSSTHITVTISRADYLSQVLKKKSISPIPGSSFGWNFLITLHYVVSLSPVSSSFQIIHPNNLVCFTDFTFGHESQYPFLIKSRQIGRAHV